MPKHRLGIIADPHYFDLFPAYSGDGIELDGRRGASVHTLADSAVSTRMFNEGYYALPAALDMYARENIRNVIIAGDLSDDGQVSAMEGAVRLLDRYEQMHGMRFFLTPGNHDAYGMSGRDITRRLMNGDGAFATYSSRIAGEGMPEPLFTEPRQRCLDYATLLKSWRRLGLQRRSEDLHWECPFGSDDRAEARMFTMTAPDGKTMHRQLDVSYLVEPEPGLWLLSIDANVFAPRDGLIDNTDPETFEDSTAAGWRMLVVHKPFILDWIEDVVRRAREAGKTLLCFSHYPVVDPLDGTAELERALLGETMSVLRAPSLAVSARICATGLRNHFSGHMHVYDRSSVEHAGRTLTNHAIPSIVAFPALVGFAEAEGEKLEMAFEALDFGSYRALLAPYEKEAARTGQHREWLDAASYPDFVYRQLREQVLCSILTKQWPEPVATFVREFSVASLAELATHADPVYATDDLAMEPGLASMTLRQFAIDLHALRMGSEVAFAYVPAERRKAYERAAALFVDRRWTDRNCLQAQVQLLLEMFMRFSKQKKSPGLAARIVEKAEAAA